jgi:hypothetical protein
MAECWPHMQAGKKRADAISHCGGPPPPASLRATCSVGLCAAHEVLMGDAIYCKKCADATTAQAPPLPLTLFEMTL